MAPSAGHKRGRYGRWALAMGIFACAPLSAEAASWQTCVEAITKTQHELKQVLPKPKQPQTQTQSVAAQDSHEPTPESLAAAGLDQPQSGPEAALNQALNLQAAGDEAGCMKAVAEARKLAGLN